MSKKIDFLAIGDITMDVFIHIKDAQVHCNLNKDNCELCFRFGDKIPFDSDTIIPAAGNSPNACISASRLGLKSALLSNIGNDQNGKNCLSLLKKEKINTKLVKIEKNKKTNYHYILWYEDERTILVKHTEFNYQLPKLKNISWIYLSSLAENSLPFYAELIESLKKNPQIKLAFQPGTFQIKLGFEKLKEIYQHTEIFFCNVEEAQKILKIESRDLLILSQKIKELGPKIVSISDGINGAYLYYNNELWHIPIYQNNKKAFEKTGAGDAFSSTIVTGLILGLDPLKAFTWGPINSMSVVQKIGSQEGLLSRPELEEYLKNAPENYKIKKLN